MLCRLKWRDNRQLLDSIALLCCISFDAVQRLMSKDIILIAIFIQAEIQVLNQLQLQVLVLVRTIEAPLAHFFN